MHLHKILVLAFINTLITLPAHTQTDKGGLGVLQSWTHTHCFTLDALPRPLRTIIARGRESAVTFVALLQLLSDFLMKR